MDLVNLAVAVVFVSNAVILILLVFMLLRILGETERTRQMMVTSSRELIDSARVVRDAGYQVRDALRNGMPVAAAGKAAETPAEASMTATPVSGIEALDKLSAMVEEIANSRGSEADRSLDDLKCMIESLSGLDPSKMADWQRETQAEMNRAIEQRDRLAKDMDAMRERLLQAHRIIIELRRVNREAMASGQTVDALKVEVAKHRQLLDRARERVQHAENRAAALGADVERLRHAAGGPVAKPDASQPATSDDAALRAAQERLAEATRQLEVHQREIARLQDAMKRTLVEKDFIEERFLRLDGERDAVVAQAAVDEANAAEAAAEAADKVASPA